MIGLKRGTVKLAPHSKEWAISFEKEKKKLEKVFGDRVVDIQHIGSTAVPDLAAKPVVDIAVGLRRAKDAKKFIKVLERAGYKFGWVFDKKFFFTKGSDSRRTHYIHVMRHGGAKWKNDLLFRSYLRTHKKRATQYADLKRKLAKQYENERVKYTEAKKSFIEETVRLAAKESIR